MSDNTFYKFFIVMGKDAYDTMSDHMSTKAEAEKSARELVENLGCEAFVFELVSGFRPVTTIKSYNIEHKRKPIEEYMEDE